MVYMLTGLVFCGVCGAAYIGNSSTNKGVHYGYYECGARDRTRTCKNRRIRKNILEGIVINEIEQSILAPELREELAKRLVDFYKKHRQKESSEQKYLDRELKRLETAMGNLLKAIESGNVSDSLLEQLKRREEEAALIRGRIKEIKEQQDIPVSKKAAVAYLESLFNRFKEKENEEHLKLLTQKFVQKVTVFEEDIELNAT